MFRTDSFEQVSTIRVDKLPHGIWPSGDGSRVYVGLENADAVAVIDTTRAQTRSSARSRSARPHRGSPTCQTRCPRGTGRQNLEPLGLAGQLAHLELAPLEKGGGAPPT